VISTNNHVMEALLDATLTGDNRRLLLVGEDGSKSVLLFEEDGIALLEGQLADARKRVKSIELAIALSRVGMILKVEPKEVKNKR
jgi:hypothetical protein